VAGAATTSTSITITISSETRTLAGAIATILAVEIAQRNYPIAAVLAEAAEIPIGGTIRNIAAARPIVTGRPQRGLEALREATRLLTVRPVLNSRLAVKAAIWPATEEAPA
jgi:hypothetical protein